MKPVLSSEETAERDSLRRRWRAGDRVPSNSLGLAYAEGDTWTCLACGQTGPDTSHADLPRCPRARSGAHTMRFTARGRTWDSAIKPQLDPVSA